MSEFDAAYFRRFYTDPKTRVTTPREMQARAALISAVLTSAQIPVRRILDAGCGIGLLKEPFVRLLPRARYTGLEHSTYLCKTYGWKRGSIESYAPPRPYDLVVCYDVLQYLGDRDAARAIRNFARLSRAALYVSALTVEDWRSHCDRSRTDADVHLRPAAWYAARLGRHFHHLGFGVWLRRGVRAILWEMERSTGCRAPSAPARRAPVRRRRRRPGDR
jgi:SAM-dependent methyltransferase